MPNLMHHANAKMQLHRKKCPMILRTVQTRIQISSNAYQKPHFKKSNRLKHATQEAKLKQLALQTLHQWHPQEKWLHIYTDRSLILGTGETAATCFSFQYHFVARTSVSNYDGKKAAAPKLLPLRWKKPVSY